MSDIGSISFGAMFPSAGVPANMSAAQISASYAPQAAQNQALINSLYGGGANAGFGQLTDYYAQQVANSYANINANYPHGLPPVGTFSDYNAGGSYPTSAERANTAVQNFVTGGGGYNFPSIPDYSGGAFTPPPQQYTDPWAGTPYATGGYSGGGFAGDVSGGGGGLYQGGWPGAGGVQMPNMQRGLGYTPQDWSTFGQPSPAAGYGGAFAGGSAWDPWAGTPFANGGGYGDGGGGLFQGGWPSAGGIQMPDMQRGLGYTPQDWSWFYQPSPAAGYGGGFVGGDGNSQIDAFTRSLGGIYAGSAGTGGGGGLFWGGFPAAGGFQVPNIFRTLGYDPYAVLSTLGGGTTQPYYDDPVAGYGGAFMPSGGGWSGSTSGGGFGLGAGQDTPFGYPGAPVLPDIQQRLGYTPQNFPSVFDTGAPPITGAEFTGPYGGGIGAGGLGWGGIMGAPYQPAAQPQYGGAAGGDLTAADLASGAASRLPEAMEQLNRLQPAVVSGDISLPYSDDASGGGYGLPPEITQGFSANRGASLYGSAEDQMNAYYQNLLGVTPGWPSYGSYGNTSLYGGGAAATPPDAYYYGGRLSGGAGASDPNAQINAFNAAIFSSPANDYNTFQQYPFISPWQASIPGNANSPEMRDAIQRVAQYQGFDPAALAAVINTENSGWNPRLRDPNSSYVGLTQMGPGTWTAPGMPGLTWNEYSRSYTAPQQVDAYSQWLDSYGSLDRARAMGIDIGSLPPEMQAALLQGFQFSPNAGLNEPGVRDWLTPFTQGDMSMPTTLKPQASFLRPYSLDAMAGYYSDLMAGRNQESGRAWPQQQLFNSYYPTKMPIWSGNNVP